MVLPILTLAALIIALSRQKAACMGRPGEFFSWAELTKTNQPYPNNPNGAQCSNLKRMVSGVLDPLRRLTDSPIYVNSAFRSFQVNQAVGGEPNSSHLKGLAADVYSNRYTPEQLKWFVQTYNLPVSYVEAESTYLHIQL